ncbi:hypothetical protein [Blastococcus saxobsidens]|uniref:hypothetical protein n=1 Tax=Blastococcus saxobsidens TaxID=138336 RepID=UPI0005A0730F|nr:hypothetical protein [Blastococcus saxobsidens]
MQTTTGTSVDLRAVADAGIDPGIAWGAELRDLATAMATGERLDESRSALIRVADRRVTAAAVGVCANFEMMNRILDATGCPVPARLRHLEGLLGIAGPQ